MAQPASAQPTPPPTPESMPQRWLVVDPSSVPHQIGWAFFEQKHLLHCGNLGRLRGDHPPMARFRHIVDEAAQLFRKLQPDLLIIEDQFLGRSPNTLRVLTASKMIWITLALQASLPVIEVRPAEWQRPFMATWQIGRRRVDLMPSIESAIRAIYPHLPPSIDDNTLCAIAIGMARLRPPVPPSSTRRGRPRRPRTS